MLIIISIFRELQLVQTYNYVGNVYPTEKVPNYTVLQQKIFDFRFDVSEKLSNSGITKLFTFRKVSVISEEAIKSYYLKPNSTKTHCWKL